MTWLNEITFDQIALSLIAIAAIRECLIMMLPNHLAGPGGRLIDTGIEKA